MKYIVITNKTIEQAAKDLEESVIKNKFGVLHIHDLKATLKKKASIFPMSAGFLKSAIPRKQMRF